MVNIESMFRGHCQVIYITNIKSKDMRKNSHQNYITTKNDLTFQDDGRVLLSVLL